MAEWVQNDKSSIKAGREIRPIFMGGILSPNGRASGTNLLYVGNRPLFPLSKR